MKKIVKAKLIVIKEQKLLLMKKRFTENKFSVIGGNRKSKESIEEALIRETMEETNVSLSANDYRYAFSVCVVEKKKRISNHYFLLLDPNKDFVLNEVDKFSELVWLPLADISGYFSSYNTDAFNTYFQLNHHEV